jgi:hypothetical protein
MKLTEAKMHFSGIRGEFQVSNEEWKKAILASNIDFPESNDPIKWIEFLEESKAFAHRFASPAVLELLYLLVNLHSGVDAIAIDRLPRENPGRAPTNGGRPPGKNKVSEMVMTGLAALGGLHIFGHPQEKKGNLIHQVAPTNEKAETQSNEGRVSFDYHTDNACFYPFQPEFLFLFGLINEEVATFLLTLDEILHQTPRDLLTQLQEPIFTLVSPPSFDFGNGRFISENRPIIFKDKLGLNRITLPGQSSFQLNEKAGKVLEQFRSHLNGLTPHRIIVKPGRLIAFRNDRVVHGREPIPTQNERWLQRIYATSDIQRYREAVGTKDLSFTFDARLLFGK